MGSAWRRFASHWSASSGRAAAGHATHRRCAAGAGLSTYYDPFSRQFAYGDRGTQPYHLGWYAYDDLTFMPTEPVRGVSGSLQVLEWNGSLRYSRAIGSDLIFAATPTWNGIFLTGPSGVALPGSFNQLMCDFQLSSVNPGPWNWQLGFTPQINGDFTRSLNNSAYLFDGRAVLLYQSSPRWRFAAGVAFWNRVHNYWIPYGGVVWTPDDHWEFRLFFPKTRISRYCGSFFGADTWLYASAEFVVQAYQVDVQDTRVKTRGQISDYQIMGGVNFQFACVSSFVEVGASSIASFASANRRRTSPSTTA